MIIQKSKAWKHGWEQGDWWYIVTSKEAAFKHVTTAIEEKQEDGETHYRYSDSGEKWFYDNTFPNMDAPLELGAIPEILENLQNVVSRRLRETGQAISIENIGGFWGSQTVIYRNEGCELMVKVIPKNGLGSTLYFWDQLFCPQNGAIVRGDIGYRVMIELIKAL